MSADFWAGYISGAAGILIGNPLDVFKVQLQNGSQARLFPASTTATTPLAYITSFIRGSAAPILGYGALNGLLFVSYNRSLMALDPSIKDTTNIPQTALSKIWIAGAAGGMASWVVSAPTELIKCRTQLSEGQMTSWNAAREAWKQSGLRGFYHGGTVTLIRDSVGYGFYFWSYELCKRVLISDNSKEGSAAETLLCGGIAGVITWASIFPLDSVKTRLQSPQVSERLLATSTAGYGTVSVQSPGAIQVAQSIYRQEGVGAFFRGLPACSIRAFIVNAVQWYIYEGLMRALKPQ